MGLLNNENEDVTNVTSESSNPYTCLKFQRTRWKQSSSWTWPMSPPLTSSDITCNQHSFRFQTNVFTQWFLYYHLICNLEAEPMKMNELFDGREDHSLIPSIPWYLTRILYSKPKLYQLIQDTSISPSWNQVHSLLFLWDPQKFPILIPMQRLESVNRWFWWFLRFDCCNILLSNQFNSQ